MNPKTDIIVDLVNRENSIYGLGASGKLYLLKVGYMYHKNTNKPIVDENSDKVLQYDWELVIDSPTVK